MLSASYGAAAVAMCLAALYLLFRLRLFVTTTTMLIGSLLLIYGPAYLSFMLSSGEFAFLFRRLLGIATTPNPMFSIMKGKIADFDAVFIAMNFSIALMYLSIIVGIEIVDRLIPNRITALRSAVTGWRAQPLGDDTGVSKILFCAISALALFMFFISFKENHLRTINEFLFSTPDRVAYRVHHGGSPNYFYRVILSGVAPMFVIWGLLAGWLNRSWPLLLSAALLFLAVFIGKSETLSKAPPAFFLIQLMVAFSLVFTNKITLRSVLIGACAVAAVLYAVTDLMVTNHGGIGTIEMVYSRVFETESQALLENFATFPFMHPFMWGTNLRPISMLLGLNYIPAFSIAAYTWYGTYDITSPGLFIADAWTDFSYAGVILYSVIAGAVCRSLDAFFLAHGKSVLGIAVLGATFVGVFTAITTALNIAFLSGGLLLAPVLAGMLVTMSRYFDRRHAISPASASGRGK